jgi:uncharacterized membrane protein (DUF373 family)
MPANEQPTPPKSDHPALACEVLPDSLPQEPGVRPSEHAAAKRFEPLLAVMDWVVTSTEVVVAALLALTAVWVLFDVVVFEIAGATSSDTVTIVHLALDRILLLFVVVELFRIAVAYIQHRAVLHTVFEAGLVAVARKIVLYNYADYGLTGAASYAVLLLVLVGAYFMLERTLAGIPGRKGRLSKKAS